MSRGTLMVVLTAVLGVSACSGDAKGQWCGVLDQGFSDGEAYCPDPEAPAACESLRDELLFHFDRCASSAGIELDDATIEEAFDDFNCSGVKAMASSEDACRDELETVRCNDNGTFDLPTPCDGVVLRW